MTTQERTSTDQLMDLIRRMDEEERQQLLTELRERFMDERRSAPRKHFLTMITYATLDRAYNDFTRDISEGGVFIETHMPFSIGQSLSMTFPVPNLHRHLKLSGEIVRLDENGVGVQFKLTTKQQEEVVATLMQLIRQHELQEHGKLHG